MAGTKIRIGVWAALAACLLAMAAGACAGPNPKAKRGANEAPREARSHKAPAPAAPSRAEAKPVAPTERHKGDPYTDLLSFDMNGSRRALAAIETEIRNTASADLPGIETKLLVVLTSPRATADARKAVCRLLRQIGGASSVPSLARLLTDKDLSQMARFALQEMACPEAGAALRQTLGKVDGDLKIGLIGSIGARRDRQAVPALAELLDSRETAIAGAAISALGRIGGADAAKALETASVSDELKMPKAEARLMCAGSMLAEGDTAAAAAIYRSMAGRKTPVPTRIAACRGLVRADKENAVERIIDMFDDDSPLIRRAAATLLGEVPGPAATKAFASELRSLPPDEQVALLTALSDCGDQAALPAVVRAAEGADPSVRTAALRAMGALGGASCVPTLASAATADDDSGRVAFDSLVRLNGPAVDEAMIKIATARDKPAARQLVIKALKERGAVSAVSVLLRLASNDADSDLRQEAVNALGGLAGPDQLPKLVALITSDRGEGERHALEQALGSVANRMNDKHAAAAPIVASLAYCGGAVRESLLAALGRVGGEAALKAVRAESKRKDAETRKAALRVLAAWSDPSPMDDLLASARNDADPACRALALRGYVELAGLPSKRPAAETVGIYRKAMALAVNADEKRLILAGLAEVPSSDALQIVEKCLNDDELTTDALAAQDKITSALESGKKVSKAKVGAKASQRAKGPGASGKATAAKGFDGVIADAADAIIHGQNAHYESSANRQCIGMWTGTDTWVSWEARIAKPGLYAVEVVQSKTGDDAATYAVEVGEQRVKGTVKNTEDWAKFEPQKLSEIRIAKPGSYTIALKPLEMSGSFVMNLRSVTLRRQEE